MAENLARLAFREEGKWWIAYMARMGTMEGATKLGSIRMSMVRSSDKAKDSFMATMKLAFAETIEAVMGKKPVEWETRSAPEHEKAGHS